MSPAATLLTLGLLLKGSLRREILDAPIRGLSKHILLPVAVLVVVSLLQTGAPANTQWPTLAAAGAVWLLFANSVNGGMLLWRERWLRQHAAISAPVLLAVAVLVPVGLFAVHVSLIRLAMLVGSVPQGRLGVELGVAGGIATAAGLGTGVLAARVSGCRPDSAFATPKLLLVSLLVTPVLYRPAALNGLNALWAAANPLCVATELARAAISFQTDAPPRDTTSIACASSGAVLCWVVFVLSTRSASHADEHG